MNTGKPILHATLTRAAGNEVRHLLIYLVDGARETRLVQLSAGSETHIATGTQYEMGQKADALAQLWITDEGFRHQPEDKFVFEPLERTITLAIRMGYTTVYDPRYKKIDPPRVFNATGEVPLSAWPGMTPKNGGGYVYALDRMRLHARPTLPPSHELNVAPSDSKEFLAYLIKVNAFLETVGPTCEFILAGD